MVIRFWKRSRVALAARLPAGIRIYAVGDIHGRADLLERVLSRIDAHCIAYPVTRPVLLFVGDYVDRGAGSREVLELLINRAAKQESVFLRGNHDETMLNYLSKPSLLRDWGKIGGFETLISYGVKPALRSDPAAEAALARAFADAMPPHHIRFLKSLASSFSCGGYFFAHAGVRPGIPLSKQRLEDLLWIRDEFLLYEEDFGKVVVHGHTPVGEIDVRQNRINIDTGAYITGRLSCLILEEDRFEPL